MFKYLLRLLKKRRLARVFKKEHELRDYLILAKPLTTKEGGFIFALPKNWAMICLTMEKDFKELYVHSECRDEVDTPESDYSIQFVDGLVPTKR
jgi:hypothetical protein